MMMLKRRGLEYGRIGEDIRPVMPDVSSIIRLWRNNEPIFLPALIADAVHGLSAEIEQAQRFMEAMLAGESLANLLASDAVADRLKQGLQPSLKPEFVLVACSAEDHDPQGIEKLYFDVEDAGKCMAEGLWCKASWLSFHDEDASLRFRFSFGMEGYEDVAADPARQHWAGILCDRIFPESLAVTENRDVFNILQRVLDGQPAFVERIVYFNAPNGGAQFHHDVERGHAGVIYAQITGRTFWLALSKAKLIEEMQTYLAQADADTWHELRTLAANPDGLSAYMEAFDHEVVEALIDREPAFIRYMLEKGHGFLLHPGDVLLMPQRDLETCVWHSVFCLDDEPGEGLSFALRRRNV